MFPVISMRLSYLLIIVIESVITLMRRTYVPYKKYYMININLLVV